MALKTSSDRESALEALKAVLQGIPGIQYVVRHAQTEVDISDANLPAVVIMEKRAKYTRFNDVRYHELNFGVDLVLLTRGRRTTKAPMGDVGTARELLCHTVINALVHNPQLYIQLDGEDEAQNHCNHVGDDFEVEYDEGMQFPYAGATVSFNVKLVTLLDDRDGETWSNWALDVTPADETGEAESSSTLSDSDTLPDGGITTVVVS